MAEPSAGKEKVTLPGHGAEDAKESHRFELLKLIARETALHRRGRRRTALRHYSPGGFGVLAETILITW